MSEKRWTDDERDEAFDRGMETMQRVALELYRRGREPLLAELEDCRARNADLRTMLEQVTRDRDHVEESLVRLEAQRDEARSALAACPDCAMWAERSARWHDDMQRAERERDEWRDKFLALNQTAGEICNACGWAFKIPGESCRCEVVKERDEARASLAQIRRVFGNAIAFDDARGDIVKMAEIAYRGACDGDKAVGELRGVIRQRDEARAEVERLRETKDYLRTWLSSEELEGLRVKAAEHPLLWEEIHHLKDEVERLREMAHDFEAMREDRDEARADAERYLADLRRCASEPYEHAKERAEAFRRGAEAMREACARWIERECADERTAWHVARLPIPEEP